MAAFTQSAETPVVENVVYDPLQIPNSNTFPAHPRPLSYRPWPGQISTTRHKTTSNPSSAMCRWARQRYRVCGHYKRGSDAGYLYKRMKPPCEPHKEGGSCKYDVMEADYENEHIIEGSCGCTST
jgi:hypothetical protein